MSIEKGFGFPKDQEDDVPVFSSEEKEFYRQVAIRNGIPEDTDTEFIKTYHEANVELAKKFGLPEDTKWEVLTKMDDEEYWREIGKSYGLPEDTPISAIEEYDREEKRKRRETNAILASHRQEMEHWRQEAVKVGLPPDATVKQILEEQHENSRKKAAKVLGLPEASSWEQIDKVELKKTAERLGLVNVKTWAEIKEYYKEHPPEKPNPYVDLLVYGDPYRSLRKTE